MNVTELVFVSMIYDYFTHLHTPFNEIVNYFTMLFDLSEVFNLK